MRRTRLFTLLMLVTFALALALPGLAVEETTQETTTETTVASGSTGTTKAPAVTIVDEAPAEELAPWTIRYLIPTSLAIGGLLVFATVVQYFLKVVRTRYKTVE